MKRFTMIIGVLLTVILFVTVPTTHATLLNAVQTQEGLLDTKVNREWLRTSISRGMSYGDVTGPPTTCNPICGGPLSGWTFAFTEDVQQLYLDVFDYSACQSPDHPIELCIPSNGAQDYRTFLTYLGDTFTHEHFNYPNPQDWYAVDGIVAISKSHYVNSLDPSLQYEIAWVTECYRHFPGSDCAASDLAGPFWPSGGVIFHSIDELVISPMNLDVWPQNERGVWLYRDVPEPSGFLLLGFGLVGLAVWGRRRPT